MFTQTRFSSWEELENAIKHCTRCPLHRSRKNAVPGEGPKDARAMLIGEAPGATEDELGRPFVGAAGRLLTMSLESIGLPRSSVYITNVVKCRPPGNREPREEEIEACSPYLESQILLLKPIVIVTLGNVAGKWVFTRAGMKWGGVTRMRGKVYEVNLLGLKLSVVPTIHPAAALYNPSLRSTLIEDLRRAKEVLEKGGSAQESSGRGTKSLLDYLKKK
ncbi:MAG: uracil-DNA glycosylase [Crenarchaeota archaeon]|nr:uracil-DNA glycosylase [Thermoproteota archaeon]